MWRIALVLLVAATGASAATDPALQAAVQDARRTPALVARDAARHPAAELAFLRLRPTATVVEVEPGAGYWTEILAPYLHAHGVYYAALPSAAEDAAGVAKFRARLAADPARFGAVRVTAMGAGGVAPSASADLVLTFRNLHDWMRAGDAPAQLAALYAALKPGGLLGVEDHRGSPQTPQDPKAASGYVRQDAAIALARHAGFQLVASSELLANPKDLRNWPAGVWTLPPSYALGARDRAKYAAIGEADNFLLLFRKPPKS